MKIKNTVPNYIIDRIPEKLDERENFIKEQLQQYRDKDFFCCALQAYVRLNQNSIREMAFNAKFAKSSTIMALNVVPIIQFSEIRDEDLDPESKSQINKFKFNKIDILTIDIENLGTAKLVLGYQLITKNRKKYFQYSVTDIKFEKQKKRTGKVLQPN